jgi:uncharacterized RDD family membrane protein YckC
MSVISGEQTALERLAAARLRGAQPDELLDLADAAIELATVDQDGAMLELIATELDAAATEHPQGGDGLRIAAARARASLPPSGRPAPASPASPASAEIAAAAEVSVHASWGSRLLAWLIDWALLVTANSLLAYMVDTAAGLLLALGDFAYFAYLNGEGGTVGKRILRIKVVDAATHEPIGTGRGAVRELVRFALAVFTLGIGLILDGLRPLWNEKHQSWHDAAAKSIVIHKGVALVSPVAGDDGAP